MVKDTLFGAIVLNTQTIDLCIVNLKTLKIVERVHSEASLGENMFVDDMIHFEAVEATSDALVEFKHLLGDYGVTNIGVYASHSIGSARNADYVQDQIFIKTGLKLKWLSKSQEAFYRNEAVAALFPNFIKTIQAGTVLVDINAGSVSLTVFNQGHFVMTRDLKVGPLRVFEMLRDVQRTAPNYVEILRDYIDSKILDFGRFLPKDIQYENVVVMGSSLSIFQNMMKSQKRNVFLEKSIFDEMYEDVIGGTNTFLMDKYQLNDTVVSQALPNVLLLYQLFKQLSVKKIWISDLKLIDGVVVNESVSQGKVIEDWEFNTEILASAENLANRYRVDQAHKDQVIQFATQLFDRLKKLHGMGQHERLLLQIAATVQDVGTFIDTQTHYEHSDYIIRSSEILGLSDSEQIMVATIAKYHSAFSPALELSEMHDVALHDRLVIAKLAAILRLADALDDSRQQKIERIRVSLKRDTLLITADANEDIELEKLTFSEKSGFFEEVYGVKAELKRK